MMGIIAVGGVIAGYGVINIMQSSSLANSSSVPKLTAPLFKLNDLPELPFPALNQKSGLPNCQAIIIFFNLVSTTITFTRMGPPEVNQLLL